MDDVRGEPLHDTREPPCRREIHLGARRDGNQLESFRRTPPQLPIGMRDERRALAARAQAVDRQQDLILPAAPGPCRICVEGEHRGSGF